MNILLYPSSSELTALELKKAVAITHADIIFNLINSLPIAAGEKVKLIHTLTQEIQKNYAPLK